MQRPFAKGSAAMHASSSQADSISDYIERISKYIPGEILAAYVVANNAIPGASEVTLWQAITVYVALLGLNALYLARTSGPVRKKEMQIAVACVAFVTWSYAIGGGFWSVLENATGQSLRPPFMTTVVPVLVTLALGLYSPDGLSARAAMTAHSKRQDSLP